MPSSVAPWRRWLERRERRLVRRQMRGYRRLEVENRLDLLSTLRNELTDTPIDSCRGRVSPAAFGAGIVHAELVIRQYLLLRVIGADKLYRALLRSLGDPTIPVTHPLPREWRAVLRRHGFAVPHLWAAAMWYGYVFLLLGYGVVGIGRQFVRSLRPQGRALPAGKCAFFAALVPSNLPQAVLGAPSHDIVSWYERRDARASDLRAICHTAPAADTAAPGGTPVWRVDGPIPPLVGIASMARYVFWSIGAIARAAVDYLRGRWWHALLLHETALAAMARMQPPDRLAREYLFHNSDALYRPLWTYDAAVRGSAVTFYFYSTNNENPKRRNGDDLRPGSWQVMNWPRYLVWDEAQAEFVRRAVGERASIETVGPIWFSCSADELPPLAPGSIAVFDVQPIRPSRYRILGLTHQLYTPATANRLLADVHAAAAERGRSIVLKRKRHIGTLVHKSYAGTVEKLAAGEHFVSVAPGISAQRVIEQAAAVVSTPFTSTALLARSLGKPSIYYDPLGVIERDDRAARDIAVVRGIDELRAWFASLEAPAEATGLVPSLVARAR